MQDLLNSKSNDNIDLHELFITLWAYKLLIASTCVLGIVLGGYHALNTEKKFTSVAIFKLDQGGSNNAMLGKLGGLASIAGFGSKTVIDSLPKDQVKGRVFIETLEPKLNLLADPYFNTYKPNAVDPTWKSLIKNAIGWQKSSLDIQEATWQGILANYSKNVAIDETKEGSARIIVTHKKAHRAAEIANIVMDQIIFTIKNRKKTDKEEQLLYLSTTIAKALSDLEVTQSNLKKFALENSALPLESFVAESLQLDVLRDQLNRTSKLHTAVEALSLAVQNNTTDWNNYLTLRKKFPVIDEVEFRRVMGQNEIISSWSWPDASSVDAVFDTLSERKSRLQSQINAAQINAERSGQVLETYAKLERKAKVAEATYTVLIEQVKAQTMAAGYQTDKSEVYEYASASINPSEPKRNLIVAVGAVLGLFLGAALSLIFALFRGVYYSKNSLRTGVQAELNASIRTLLPLRNKSLDDINSMLAKKPRNILRNIAIHIHKNSAKQVVVTSTRAKLKGSDVARALSSYMQSETTKIAVIDFSSSVKKLDTDVNSLLVGSFVVAESAGHVSVLRPDGDTAALELLSKKDFRKKIQSLNSTFNLVFLCADGSDAIDLLSALKGQEMFHITLARTKKTKSATLMHMRSLLPIQGLLHD